MLVCNATPSMTPMIALVLADDAPIPFIFATTLAMTSPPWLAADFAVRSDRSIDAQETSWLAFCTGAEPCKTADTTWRRLLCITPKVVIGLAASSLPQGLRAVVRLPGVICLS